MQRFFVPNEWVSGPSVSMSGSVAHQISRVLRARPGDRVTALDGSGWEYVIELNRVSADVVDGRVVERNHGAEEPEVKTLLYQAVLKADRFELVLQKGTELGVSTFVPMSTTYSVPTPPVPERSPKFLRWSKIIQEAAEQCGRARLPVLESPMDFAAACESTEGLSLMPWEGERSCGFSSRFRGLLATTDTNAVNLFIGPEGGFTHKEAALAKSLGIVSVSMGRRILRSETAAVAAISAVMYELGELGC